MLYTDGNIFNDQRVSMRAEIAQVSAGLGPGVAVTLWNKLAALPAEKYLTYIVIIYTLVQLVVMIRKEFLSSKRRRRLDRLDRFK